ncbi:MAG: triose-phosphate isomerase [Gemmatimonadota bacterium]
MSAPSRPTIVAANWKMYKTMADVGPYMTSFFDAMADVGGPIRLVFFPAAVLVPEVVEAVATRARVGGQNCHWETEGAYTGEISPGMLIAAGARLVLVGHSERRQLCGETDVQCAKKVGAALNTGLDPMLCVGETLEEREAGRQQAVVLGQLSRAIDGLSRDEYGRLTLAYEPVWAIGTGRTAAPADAQQMHATIRDAVASIASPSIASAMPILYGGSVKPENAAELIGQPDIDGALVGGASLDPCDFAAIAAVAATTAA